MIVVDASVLASAIGDDGADGQLARERLRKELSFGAPDLVDVETVSILRKRWLSGDLSQSRFSTAVDDLADLDFDRYPTSAFMRRAFELRANVTPYDASYVALAEGLECPLLTADVRLANSPGLRCAVMLL